MATISILYDNRAGAGLWPGWGFSARLCVKQEVVLFDTGADKLVFEHNAQALDFRLRSVTALALSHEHCDHIGAVSAVLHKGLHLYVPVAFAKRFAGERRHEIGLTGVRGPTQIVAGVQSIGQFGRKIPEQALVVDGEEGPSLITGCAHEGIVNVVRLAMEAAQRPLDLVLGGFHLYRAEEADVRRTANELLGLSVKRIAPCHCTGDAAIRILRDVFGSGFLDIAAGSRIDV